MQIVETVNVRAAFLRKEVRRVVISEIGEKDLPELYKKLNEMRMRQHKNKFWICIGRHDTWFNNRNEFSQFLHGFTVGLKLLNDAFFDE